MKIKLTENKLKQIVAESVKNILSEAISPDYRSALKQLFAKSFGNLDDNEKQYLYDLLSNETWETVYVALGVLESNRINESRKKREPRRGTIELNGKHIDAVEDGMDKNGNPMYKVNDPSIKGRRCKDGSIRVQHYNFKPNRINEGKDIISMDSIYNQVLEHIVDFLERGDMEIKFGNMNGQSFDVYLPLSEKYLEISYMGKTIKMPLNKRVEDLSDESIARSIMNGFAKLYDN